MLFAPAAVGVRGDCDAETRYGGDARPGAYSNVRSEEPQEARRRLATLAGQPEAAIVPFVNGSLGYLVGNQITMRLFRDG